MTKKKDGGAGGCCRVASLLSVDERGQMILPKEIREKAGIKAGDKLAVVVWENKGAFCCLTLIKADGLGGMVKEMLGPVMAGLVRE
ncbi:MAG: HgcAB-associated protein [Acidobacteriota bacterium]|nr:HgcAB-associated protein [Acidobacteriota bacterium]